MGNVTILETRRSLPRLEQDTDWLKKQTKNKTKQNKKQ